MRDSVQQWLEKLNLGKYVDDFARNDIDWDIVPALDHETLKDIGVRSAGDRLRILGAARALTPDAETPSDSPESTPDARHGDAERRQLTVMFCDLVGSTELSTRMDPEELRGVLARFQSAIRLPIERYDGYVARFMGDGLLVYFGYPRAHEEDTERAIRAGLDIVEAVRALSAGETRELKVRVGIATGLVVAGDIVGEGASEERAVLGDTPNLAARLQSAAPPNTVLVAESTRSLTRGRFEFEAQAPRALKGIREPVIAYRVVGLREGSRFEATSVGTRQRMVGRDEELAMLTRRWELARSGEGQVVLLGGEPGIGKSRLAEALRERTIEDRPVVLVLQCSPYHVNSAFHPVMVYLERAAGFDRADPPELKLEKLACRFEATSRELGLLATLLSLPSDRFEGGELTPQKRKAETIRFLAGRLETRAAEAPLLLILEDAHWVDHSTLELFDEVSERIGRIRALLVVTHRPEFSAAWVDKGQVTRLTLNHLGRNAASSLMQSVAGEERLPDAWVTEIFERTDGVPLFIEELTKTLLDTKAVAADGICAEREIPSTIQDSLVARLDRLDAAKEIAQIGATLGREFSYALVAEVAAMDATRLRDHLQRLEAGDLIIRRGAPPESSYVFKHALVRDAAYATLLHQRRRNLHRRVADALRHTHTELVQAQPELLAHHLTEAGDIYAATEQWLRAGQLAFGRSAAREAQAHLEKGRTLLQGVDDESSAGRELEFCVALGPVYMTTKGAHAADVEQVYVRAREISRQLGDRHTEFKALWGQWHAKQVSGALEVSTRLAEDCLNLSGRLEDSECELQAHHASWSTQFFRGLFEPCLAHADRGWALYDFARHATHRFTFGGHDPAACSRYFGGMCHWFLGRPATSAVVADEALRVARRIEHPFSLVVTLLYTAYVAYLRQEPEKVCTLAQESVEICERLGFPTWLPGVAQLRDWSSVVMKSDGCALARMSTRVARDAGPGQITPGNAMFYVDACLRMGDRQQGMRAVTEGLALAEALGHRWVIPELHRLHAGLIDQEQPGTTEAAEKLRLSLELAAGQKARSIEMRAAVDLARIALRAADRETARAALLPVYDSFEEGFDTPDLRAARAVLAEL
jgi:class 3 adenylate cyclase